MLLAGAAAVGLTAAPPSFATDEKQSALAPERRKTFELLVATLAAAGGPLDGSRAATSADELEIAYERAPAALRRELDVALDEIGGGASGLLGAQSEDERVANLHELARASAGKASLRLQIAMGLAVAGSQGNGVQFDTCSPSLALLGDGKTG